jgi:hypothetical protein
METRTVYFASLEKEQGVLWYFGGLRIIKMLGEQISDPHTIFEYREPAGTYTYSYAPYQEDMAFYIIEGEASFSNEETTIHALPGTFLFMPRNVPFRYQVTKAGPATILTWTTPGGFVHRVMGMGEPGQAFVLAPPPIIEREKMQQLTTLLRATAQTSEKL